jgi:hypothetical protein
MENFPIKNAIPNKCQSVPWAFAESLYEQIYHNHGQKLERLAERGGLSYYELYAAHQRKELFDSSIRHFCKDIYINVMSKKIQEFVIDFSA